MSNVRKSDGKIEYFSKLNFAFGQSKPCENLSLRVIV
jgi:hypothetical protein